jgi:hypothetical protein
MNQTTNPSRREHGANLFDQLPGDAVKELLRAVTGIFLPHTELLLPLVHQQQHQNGRLRHSPFPS